MLPYLRKLFIGIVFFMLSVCSAYTQEMYSTREEAIRVLREYCEVNYPKEKGFVCCWSPDHSEVKVYKCKRRIYWFVIYYRVTEKRYKIGIAK